MDLPLVSFVMPVYNAEKYLKESIESVLRQTYANIELVIINDGSADMSRSIIMSFDDPRIRYYENERNSGIVFTRNRGIENANGKYIAILDSDDIAVQDRIEIQVKFLESHPEYSMCGTFYHTIDSEGKLLKKMTLPSTNTSIRSHLLIGNCFCNSTALIGSKWVKDMRYTEQYDIIEDYVLWYRLSKKSKLINLPVYSTYYRVHDSNISQVKINDMYARLKTISSQILADLDITYSDNELEVHANLLTININNFRSIINFRQLEPWVVKLYQALKRNNKYDNQLLFKLIAEKWILVCYKTKRHSKLFLNRLILLNPPAYIKILLGRLYSKFLKK